MKQSSNGHVPRCVGRHDKANEGPDSVVVEGRNKYCGGAASPKDVCPCPLVQVIVYVVDVTVISPRK